MFITILICFASIWIVNKSLIEPINKLVSEFLQRQKNRDGKPWENPKAAIGYALYDGQTDSGVEPVFKRADSMMYEHKKEMKNSSSPPI